MPQEPCPSCGAMNKPNVDVCEECGRPLAVMQANDSTKNTIVLPDEPSPIVTPTPATPAEPSNGFNGSAKNTIVLPDEPDPLPANTPVTNHHAQPPIVTPTPATPPEPANNFLRIAAKRPGLTILTCLQIVVLLGLCLSYVVSSSNLPSLPSGIGTVQFPNGEYVGVNDGSSFPFDIQRQDPQNLRQQAMQSLQPGASGSGTAISQWNQYLAGQNVNDAEVRIYLGNQYVYASHKKYVTLMVGLDFSAPALQAKSPDATTATRSALQGACIAQQEFNDQHKDIQLRLLLVNTGDDANYITPVAQQIASIVKKDATIVGILGWQTSVRTVSMLAALQQTGTDIPLVSQTASSDYLTKDVPANFFHVVPPNSQQAQAALSEAKKGLGATQAIVFIDPNDPYSQNLGQDFEKKFPNHIEEDFTVEQTLTASYNGELKDALEHVQDPNRLVVFFTGTTNYDVGQFQDALSSYPSLQVIAGDAGYVAHKTIYGRWYIVAYAFHDEWTQLMGTDPPFIQEYATTFGSSGHPERTYGYIIPDAAAIASYDAAKVLSRGIDMLLSAGNSSPTRQELENILPSVTWPGVSGQIAFDDHHDPADKALVVLQVNDVGKLHMICIQGNFSDKSNHSVPPCDS